MILKRAGATFFSFSHPLLSLCALFSRRHATRALNAHAPSRSSPALQLQGRAGRVSRRRLDLRGVAIPLPPPLSSPPFCPTTPRFSWRVAAQARFSSPCPPCASLAAAGRSRPTTPPCLPRPSPCFRRCGPPCWPPPSGRRPGAPTPASEGRSTPTRPRSAACSRARPRARRGRRG